MWLLIRSFDTKHGEKPNKIQIKKWNFSKIIATRIIRISWEIPNFELKIWSWSVELENKLRISIEIIKRLVWEVDIAIENAILVWNTIRKIKLFLKDLVIKGLFW